MKTILLIFGTRPEAIKLCPLVHELRSLEGVAVKVVVTAQHREMLDQVLAAFQIQPDYDLNVMTPGQSLSGLTSKVLDRLEPVMKDARPSIVIVQGDTTSTLAGALSAFYAGVPIAHVEAGLRTGDISQPFPEEANRVLTARLATFHFAPTSGSADNLRAEGVPEDSIHVTGNTGIDAVFYVRDALASGRLKAESGLSYAPNRHLIVVTTHRRENFGEGFEKILRALARIARRDDVELIYPVHRNPRILGPAYEVLEGNPNIRLMPPMAYVEFVDILRRSTLIITDSGGIQEEAPSLGKPVLVLREKTERPEAVAAGTVRLVGTDEEKIVLEASELLDNPAERENMSRIHNPYGDGKACARIAAVLGKFVA